MTGYRLDHHMYVVRHKAPGQHSIALTVEMQQRSLDEGGNLRLVEPTCPEPHIQFSLDAMNVRFSMKQRFRNCFRRAIANRNVTNWTVSGVSK
jgi:hypothetical protein